MNKDTLYWTVGGVAIALLALYAVSQKGAGTTSRTSTVTPSVSASNLTSQVNAYNADAAAVTETLLNDSTQYSDTQLSTNAALVANKENNATAVLQANDQMSMTKFADSLEADVAELDAKDNLLASEANDTANEYASKLQSQYAENALSTQRQEFTSGTIAEEQLATMADSTAQNIAATQSNAVEQASSNSMWGNIFGGIGSALAGFFSGNPFGGSSSYSVTPSSIASLYEPQGPGSTPSNITNPANFTPIGDGLLSGVPTNASA
jgi:hypothetical protein